ncbi:MAG: sterol desaturase family protein [Pseudanabaenaceae cyanobacterium bins.39]|nr:sterol desaturase family protein [Pseudanabaenaceae cyanobacterium bins.39]
MQYEAQIRLGFFFGTFGLMFIWEAITPYRQLVIPKPLRWFNNLILVMLNTFLVRAILPLSAAAIATFAKERGWGLLNLFSLSPWQTVPLIIISIIYLDLVIYWQHNLFHRIPMLWRLHRVHHADRDFDITTGLRFHPLEILLSMMIKFVAILVMGVPAIAVVIFEILLNATAIFNHGNVSLPHQVDRLLRLFVVTPNMHRIHHSIITQETNSNFGFNLPWWDHLFKTYRAHSVANPQQMAIGLAEYQQTLQVTKLPWLLTMPFQSR